MINNTNKINYKIYVTQNNYNHINLFYASEFRLDEKILKNIKHGYISPADSNNKIRFIIYSKKFKTLNLVVNNNYFPPTKKMEKTNIIYQFKCPLGECISDNK